MISIARTKKVWWGLRPPDITGRALRWGPLKLIWTGIIRSGLSRILCKYGWACVIYNNMYFSAIIYIICTMNEHRSRLIFFIHGASEIRFCPTARLACCTIRRECSRAYALGRSANSRLFRWFFGGGIGVRVSVSVSLREYKYTKYYRFILRPNT